MKLRYQSPYKGFNSNKQEEKTIYEMVKYQSPYKGFNSHQKSLNGQRDLLYQSPYKGFNS